MKKDKQQAFFINIGSSSLLVIFLVLCLATFAILSLSSAQSDFSFSQRLAAHKSAYYEASSKAEAIIGEIDRILSEAAQSSDCADLLAELPKEAAAASPYGAAVILALDKTEMDGILLSCESAGEDLTVFFQVPLNDKQALEVVLSITDYTKHENYYTVKAWQVVSQRLWEEEQPLNLMPMED